MLGLEFLEELLGRADSALLKVFHAPPDAFGGVGARGYIE